MGSSARIVSQLILGLLALASTPAWGVKAPPPMTLPAANHVISAWGAKKGLIGLRLNEFAQARAILRFKDKPLAKGGRVIVERGQKHTGPFPLGTLYFSLVGGNVLRVYVSIFREPMLVQRRENFFDRINAAITTENTAGAQIVHVADADTYYLAKSYRVAMSPGAFMADVASLEKAAHTWVKVIGPRIEIEAKARKPIPTQKLVKIENWRLE